MPKKVEDNIVMSNAHIIFRNFSGREGKYNRAGSRNFNVVLDPDVAQHLTEDGWNVRKLEPRNPEDEPLFCLQVQVKFEVAPPTIWLVTRNSKTAITEDTVDMLDNVDIKKVDLIIRPYNWDVNGKSGVKAYLKTMYLTIEEDAFASQYEFPSADEVPFD